MVPANKFEQRKRELLSQIKQLVKVEGLDKLTIRKICRELNISIGTFYHYFSEKSDLAWVMFSDMDMYFEYDVTNNFTDNEITNLIDFCLAYARYVVNNGLEAALYLSVIPFKHQDRHYFAEDRAVFQVLLGIIQRGIDKQQIVYHQSEKMLAQMILVLLRGYFTDWAKCCGNYDLVKSTDNFIQLFVKALIVA